MKSNFYFSSMVFGNKPIEQIINDCSLNKFNLEFSSGLKFDVNMEEIYINAPVKRLPHNYFPAPKKPFVLNLASNILDIRIRSIEHCKKGLLLAKKSNSPFFAAHAGFYIDPNPNELGKKIVFKKHDKLDENKSYFLDSIRQILKTAHELEIDFLIENNVLAPFNFNGFNPLFCCDSENIDWLFTSIKDKRLGLLLDTAHLKVSCTTLGKNLNSEYTNIQKYVTALHHSDNDGTKDTNDAITEDYWFLNHLKKHRNSVHVLEVKPQSVESLNWQINLLANNGD